MTQPHPDVYENVDGHLFLSRGRHDVFAHATGAARLNPDTLSNFIENIRRRSEYCEMAGVAYRHVIFPDKQTVLRDRLPDVDIVGLGVQFTDAVRPAPILYLAETLRSVVSTGDDEVFLRTDTHMTDFGSAVASRVFVDDVFPHVGTDNFARIESRLVREVEFVGDLGGKLDPVRSDVQTTLDPDWALVVHTNRYLAGNDGIIDILLSPESVTPRRLVIFGDSFARKCLTPLSMYFREILFLRSRYFHPEIIDQIAPDVVMTQNVERYLVNVPRDRDRPNALLYPQLGGNAYEPPKEFVQVLDAMLAHRHDPERLQRLVPAMVPTNVRTQP